MRKIILFSLLVWALVSLFSRGPGLSQILWAAPVPKPLAEKSYEELVEGAKKEGAMTIWTSIAEAESFGVLKAFNKKYPFIKLSATQRRADDCREALLMEAAAGRKSDVDVFDIDGVDLVPLKKKGIVLGFPWTKLAKIDPRALDPDNMGVATQDSGSNLTYNTKLISPDKLPRSYEDLLKPEWKGGKIGLDIRGFLWSELVTSGSWTKEKGIDFGKKLLTQEPKFGKGQGQMADLIVAGEFPIGVSAIKNVIVYKRRGAPLEWVPLEPVAVWPTGFSVYKEAKHPHCGILFVAWMSSPEGQMANEEYAGRSLPFPGLNTRMSRMLEGKKLAVVGWSESDSALQIEMQNTFMKMWGAR